MSQKLIFLVDDDDSVRRLLEHALRVKLKHTVRGFPDGESCIEALEENPDLIILDCMMPGLGGVETMRVIHKQQPDIPVIILSSQSRLEVAVEAIKEGAIDYLPKSVDLPKLEVTVKNALEMASLKRRVTRLQETVEKNYGVDNIITTSKAMDEVLRLIHKARQSDISVLIQGESGTGKELVAQAIHFNGNRHEGPFIAVNCAAIPGELLESEMFGHEKGAFTGAVGRKIGKFEQAHTGTIFLDEIGELDANLQAKLLRVTQLKQLERVGGNGVINVDVRIIVATNRDLLKSSRKGEFREDLYYRLASFPILVPPLRDRVDDILLLAEHFLKRYAAEQNTQARRFSRGAIKLIYDYPWPGNVRELQSAIQRAALLSEGEVVDDVDLPVAVQSYGADPNRERHLPPSAIFDDVGTIMTFDRLKEAAVSHALRITDGNVQEAARRLGISRSTIYGLIGRINAGEEESDEHIRTEGNGTLRNGGRSSSGIHYL